MVEWEKDGETPERLRHKVCLVGAKPPHNFLYLTLNPAKEGEMTCYVALYPGLLTPAFVSLVPSLSQPCSQPPQHLLVSFPGWESLGMRLSFCHLQTNTAKGLVSSHRLVLRLALFPGLPWICSLVCVQYNTRTCK